MTESQATSQLPVSVVVLAAGRGARMRSKYPKSLQQVCGRAMLLHVLDAVEEINPRQTVVVVGFGAEEVTKHVAAQALKRRLEFASQPIQRGTADAAGFGLTALDSNLEDEDLLLLFADTPLIQAHTLQALVGQHRTLGVAATVGISSDVLEEPKDQLTPKSAQAFSSVNGVAYCVRRSLLAPALRRLAAGDSGLEYDLSDAVNVLSAAGHHIATFAIDNKQAQGVDNLEQLACVEAHMRQRINSAWMLAGVRIIDPLNTYVDATVQLAPDVVIYPGVVLQGHTFVGEGAVIGPYTHLVDCVIGSQASIEAVSATDVEVGAQATVGSYVQLAPGSQIPPKSKAP